MGIIFSFFEMKFFIYSSPTGKKICSNFVKRKRLHCSAYSFRRSFTVSFQIYENGLFVFKCRKEEKRDASSGARYIEHLIKK